MKKRILIVDDEERIRHNYVELFRSRNGKFFDVLEAPDATKATNILIREKIDLILLDINMPEVNGQNMYEVIREYDPQMKVMIASVYPEEEQRRLIPNANQYYDKSQGPLKLLEKVLEMLFVH